MDLGMDIMDDVQRGSCSFSLTSGAGAGLWLLTPTGVHTGVHTGTHRHMLSWAAASKISCVISAL